MDTLASPNPDTAVASSAAAPRRGSLSNALLLYTVAFVMLAEILIFVPSIAFFRLNWLIDRLNLAQVAALVVEAAPDSALPDMLRDELLRSADVRAITVRRPDQRRVILSVPIETAVSQTFDLVGDGRTTSLRAPGHWFSLIRDALMVFMTSGRDYVRIIGQPAMGRDTIEIVIPNAPLRTAMIQHALNILGLSVAISLLTAVAVYFTLNRLLVAPMMRLTGNMIRFRANPEDASRIIRPSDRDDEIGVAESELAEMQTELHDMLAQKSRLAALGLAVSKINHDLRNLLANAQLLSDRLVSLPDPQVQRIAPKFVASLDRAIKFCNETLQFGRAAEPAPRRDLVPVRDLAVEVGEGLGLPRPGEIDWRIDVPTDLAVDADRDQVYRVLSNIVRNSIDAMMAMPKPGADAPARAIALSAHREGDGVIIDVVDDGPGLPAKARDNLFQPFQSSTRRGGTGLGLAIAQEIIVAHGGRITLVDDNRSFGAHFRITIPDQMI